MTDAYDATWAAGSFDPGRRKNNWAATTDPVGTDDIDSGYGPGSVWVNATAGRIFAAVTTAVGIADWNQIDASGVTDHGALTGLGDDDHPQYRQRRVVMRPGISSPPEPVSNVNGDGWVYMEID